jgi:hypothetical protein
VLILRLPCHRWSRPLVGEEQDNMSGGTLDGPLWVALPSVPGESESVESSAII